MIKKLFILAILTTFCMAAKAGDNLGLINFGVKAGLTAQHVKFSNPDAGDYSLSTDSKMGFHVGIISRINLVMFHIQPEILYSHTSYKLTSTAGDRGTTSSTSKVKIDNVEVPVLIGLRLLWFRLQAGPMFNLMTETSVSDKGTVDDVVIQKPAASFLIGLGFDIGKLNLDVRYNGQFARTDQGVGFGKSTVNYKSKLNSWMFSVGYLF